MSVAPKRDLMLECDALLPHDIGGKRVMQWVHKLASVLRASTIEPEKIRCHHCNGAVKTHWQRKVNGPQDHFEHHAREDSEGCSSGFFFDGTFRKSKHPVT